MAIRLLRSLPFFRHHRRHHHHLQRLVVGSSLSHRPWSTLTEPVNPDNNSGQNNDVLSLKEAANRTRWENDPDYRKWKLIEVDIIEDIEPITYLAKEILHSQRYKDGERLTAEDEKAVVEGLLAYHPHYDDKIGCGLESIMRSALMVLEQECRFRIVFSIGDTVDRHPQFQCSRCLFVVRTDGGLIDFSYNKCIHAYIQEKYPSHAERFCKENFICRKNSL